MTASLTSVDRAPGNSKMGIVDAILFFIAVPVLLAVLLGSIRAGNQKFTSMGYQIGFTVCLFLTAWISWGIGTKVISIVLRPWRPPLILVLMLGHLLGGFLGLSFPRSTLNATFEPYLQPGTHYLPFWPPENFVSWGLFALQGLLMWIGLNWLDFRYRGVPRFGFQTESAAELALPIRAMSDGGGYATATAEGEAAEAKPKMQTPAPGAPTLLRRMPAQLAGAEILALEAEEHYTKVHTNRGATLLLIRFTDAIEAMEPQPGFRVHRSFWVSRHAMDRVEWRGRRLVAILKNKLEIPISRSFRVVVQGAGFLDREGRPTVMA